ncbi:carboxypeptidase regulatory-like domain-containing protein [Acidicapsa dinghuensis]|uniref:Carboxypeptidase regulatory-like domain-containing protein n=1 Tax=Acidicapsa dinghuensis TaxID=2218256 RepID=A0ABW1EE06_9BACT|nr:carboxypeptidase-like regulatory domain-containing protein [Acidicapsa dinghuensis]
MRHIPIPKERQRRRLPSPQTWAAFALAVAFGFLALMAPRTASAQASSGVTGTVTDSSGAVISGASVTITDESTSVTAHTVTESAGTYSFRGLNPGKYKISVDAPGFKKAVKSDVTLEVSREGTVDFTLSTGATTETVQVTADQIALNTTQPELGSTIEPVVVEALPSEVSGRGRQIDSLQFLAPGVTGSTFSHRVSGGADFEEEIVYNGIPVPQSETEGYTTNYDPPYDFVQEFRVERTTFSAQFGLGQGALTYQMKSGTNQYHGNAFEINRNSFFDSVGFFNGPNFNSANVDDKAPVDHENNYGFSVGGPIRIPHLYDGRNKTFGYYSQEWYKQNTENLTNGTVPTVAEKTGDFSNYLGTNKAGDQIVVPIYDPTTGKQFQCNGVLNVICPDRISPIAASLLQYIPDPDNSGTGVGGQTNNKNFVPFISPQIQHIWGFTVDQTLTPTQSLHYSEWRNTFHNYGFDNAPIVQPFGNPVNPLESLRYYPNVGTVFLLNYSNTITPHLVMTAGAGWIGEINNQFNVNKFAPVAVFYGVQQEDIMPSITFDGQHATTSFGTGGSNSGSVNRKLGLAAVNNWLWTKGRNTFNIGGEARRSYQDDNEEQTEGGHYAFSQRTTSIENIADPNFNNYGSSFASFLLGLPDEADRSNSLEERLRNFDISPYVMDDIKLSPKLTVNIGVRWDIQVPFTENHNQIVFFNQDNPGTDPSAIGPNGPIAGSASKFGDCTGCAGFNRADIHWGHFGPRFGLAYKLNDKTVLQGGFAIAFLNGGAYEYGTNKVAVNDGNLLVGQFHRASSSTWVSNPGSWDITANQITPTTPVTFGPGIGGGNQIEAFSKNDGYAPYSQQWNINLQRELPYNMLLTAAWVGNRVIHLPSQLNRIDQMDPAFDAQYGNVQSSCNPGTSVLSDNFGPYDPILNPSGCAAADGFSMPYTNFYNDFGNSSSVAQSLVPYPQYNYIFNNFEAKGTDFYNSAQIEVDKRFSNGLSFLAGYTLSRLMANANSGFSSFANGGINKYNQGVEYTIDNNDETNTVKISGTYELPIGPGKKFVNNHKLGNVVGGWQVGWVLDYESGTPFGVGESGTPFPNGFNRPNRNPGVGVQIASYDRVRDYFTKQGGQGTGPSMFNSAAFSTTATQYVIGNAVRNYSGLRGAPLRQEAFNARKHFYIGEKVQAILQVDYFNAFNRTQFGGPDTNASDGTFTQDTSTGSGLSNRQGQVKLELQF